MANNYVENIWIEGAQIRGRNFSGKKFGDGKKSFGVIFDEETALRLMDIGWNLKKKASTDPDEPPKYIMYVKVAYENFPPTVWSIANRHKTLLNDETIGSLDGARIQNVDLEIRPYNYKGKISAYLKEMWVTIIPSRFEEKYAYLDDPEDDLPFN